MAAIDTIRTAPVAPFAWVSKSVAAIATWNDRRVTRKALGQLTMRELEDIGLTPGDIERI